MNKTLLAALLLAAAPAAAEGLPSFQFTNAAQLRAEPFKLAAPPAAAGDVLTENSMLIQAGKTSLFGFAQTRPEFERAAAYWTAALTSAGVKAGTPAWADGMYQIPYATADGRVIRDFLADPKQFPPKDDAGLRANMADVQGALAKAGLTVVAARVVKVDVILPTYSILYLTKPDQNPDHETRLRVLKPGDDLDFSVFRAAGLNILQTPQPWMMVYLGPSVGYVGLWGHTPADLAAKVEKRRQFLEGEGGRVVAVRDFPIDDADFPYGAGLYFFR
jgi:hypothetical protein